MDKKGCTYFQKTGEGKNSDLHFFSTSHCQPNIPPDYIPVSFSLRTKDEVINSYLYNSIEVPNPDPQYQG